MIHLYDKQRRFGCIDLRVRVPYSYNNLHCLIGMTACVPRVYVRGLYLYFIELNSEHATSVRCSCETV